MFKQKSHRSVALLAITTIPLLLAGASSAHAHGESIRGGGSINTVGAAILEESVGSACVEPQPSWEAAERRFMIHYTKNIENANHE